MDRGFLTVHLDKIRAGRGSSRVANPLKTEVGIEPGRHQPSRPPFRVVFPNRNRPRSLGRQLPRVPIEISPFLRSNEVQFQALLDLAAALFTFHNPAGRGPPYHRLSFGSVFINEPQCPRSIYELPYHVSAAPVWQITIVANNVFSYS